MTLKVFFRIRTVATETILIPVRTQNDNSILKNNLSVSNKSVCLLYKLVTHPRDTAMSGPKGSVNQPPNA